MSLKTFGRITSFSFAILHRVCLLCRIWFASKMEKFSNDFLTAGIAALPISFRCCELNYWLRSQCTCETSTRKLLIRSVRCLFVFLFPSISGLFPCVFSSINGFCRKIPDCLHSSCSFHTLSSASCVQQFFFPGRIGRDSFFARQFSFRFHCRFHQSFGHTTVCRQFLSWFIFNFRSTKMARLLHESWKPSFV